MDVLDDLDYGSKQVSVIMKHFKMGQNGSVGWVDLKTFSAHRLEVNQIINELVILPETISLQQKSNTCNKMVIKLFSCR